MSTQMPRDKSNTPIPALGLRDGGAHELDSSATAIRNTIAFDDVTRVLSVFATQPVYIAFGDSNVTATTSSHYFPAGLYFDFAIGGGKRDQATHISVLQVQSAGKVYISEKQ